MSACIHCCYALHLYRRNKQQQIKEEPIPFVIPITEGKVIKVYDGDTITVQFRLPYKKSKLYKISVRLNSIDCPELKTKNEIEKQCSKIAKFNYKQRYSEKVYLENFKEQYEEVRQHSIS